MTSFILTKTLYGFIENNCVRFKKSSNLQVWSTLEAPGGRTVQNRKFLWRYKLFKIQFLTTFVSIKTLYNQIWNFFVDQIYLVFEFFKSFRIWATPGGWTMHPERLIMKINLVWNYISDNFHFDHITLRSNPTELFFLWYLISTN